MVLARTKQPTSPSTFTHSSYMLMGSPPQSSDPSHAHVMLVEFTATEVGAGTLEGATADRVVTVLDHGEVSPNPPALATLTLTR